MFNRLFWTWVQTFSQVMVEANFWKKTFSWSLSIPLALNYPTLRHYRLFPPPEILSSPYVLFLIERPFPVIVSLPKCSILTVLNSLGLCRFLLVGSSCFKDILDLWRTPDLKSRTEIATKETDSAEGFVAWVQLGKKWWIKNLEIVYYQFYSYRTSKEPWEEVLLGEDRIQWYKGRKGSNGVGRAI